MPVEIPIDLIKHIERGNCVLFVGAGQSMDAGLPGWGQLLAPIYRALGCSFDTDPLRVAQVYVFRQGRRSLVDHICDKTDTTSIALPANLLRLAEITFKTWVTTNYDDLIERAFTEHRKPHNPVVWDSD